MKLRILYRTFSALFVICLSLFLTTGISGCRVYYLFFGGTLGPALSHAQLAQQAASDGHSEKAVEEYQIHMQERLSDPKRPESENPYFYEILIGDIYLKDDKLDMAQTSYVKAQTEKVDPPLVCDRLRQLARALAAKGKFQAGIDLLHAHRDLDIEAMDYEISELHRKLIAAEDAREHH